MRLRTDSYLSLLNILLSIKCEDSIEPKRIAMVTTRSAVREAGARYKRHQPELTLLY